MSIPHEALEFFLQLFQQDVDLAQAVGNFAEAALSCIRAGCVTNVDGLWLLPGAGEGAQAVTTLLADPRLALAVIFRPIRYGGK